MEPKKNLCAQIPVSLHTRIRQEQEESGKSLSEFMTELLTNYYENGGTRKMGGKQRTVAFQVPEELFEQFKEYLKQHNMKQNAFFLDCIHRALAEAQEEREAASNEGDGENPPEKGPTPEGAEAGSDGEAEVDTGGQDEDAEENGTEE